MRQVLKLHPDFECAAVRGIAVEVARTDARLALRYVVAGDIGGLAMPALTAPVQTDELWRTTCFEAFVRGPAGEGYLELNLAPSTQWAAYSFDGYRQGMRAEDAVGPPAMEVKATADSFALQAAVDLSRLTGLQGPWRLGLSAVIETADGRVSYWALGHPPGRPDFHHPDCFALELPAVQGA